MEGSYVAQTLLSWIRACRTHVLCAFLRICHMSTCHVHFNVAVSVQRWKGEWCGKKNIYVEESIMTYKKMRGKRESREKT